MFVVESQAIQLFLNKYEAAVILESLKQYEAENPQEDEHMPAVQSLIEQLNTLNW